MSKYNKEWARKYYQENRERINEYSRKYQMELLQKNPQGYYKNLSEKVKKWRIKNPEKNRAHKIIFVELRAGRIKKKSCFCGENKSQAHHEDYSKPLEIIWLCKRHHIEADIRLRELSTVSY